MQPQTLSKGSRIKCQKSSGFYRIAFQTYKIQHLSLLDPPFPLSKKRKTAFWS